MDSLTATRRSRGAAQGRAQPPTCYNIQQQLVQLQELTGQSQQRLTELQHAARGAGRADGGGARLRATARGSTPAARPAAAAASADQMYEASLAQLRRGSAVHRAPRLARDAPDRTPPASGRRTRSTSSGRASRRRIPIRRRPTTARWWTSTRRRLAPRPALYNLGLLAERRKDMAKARGRLPAGDPGATPSPTRPRWRVTD